jgi:hypothetical protein
MVPDLSLFLTLMIPAVLAGAVIGLLLRRYRRSWCVQYAASTAAMPWWMFACCALVFALLAASRFAAGQPAFGTGFALIGLLQVFAMASVLFRKTPPEKPTT